MQVDEAIDLPVSGMLAQSRDCQCTTDEQSRVLGNDGRQCDTFDFHAKPDDEYQVQRDVRDIDCQEYRQWYAGILHSQEPADQRKVGERSRRTPDSYEEIGCCVLLRFGIAAE